MPTTQPPIPTGFDLVMRYSDRAAEAIAALAIIRDSENWTACQIREYAVSVLAKLNVEC